MKLERATKKVKRKAKYIQYDYELLHDYQYEERFASGLGSYIIDKLGRIEDIEDELGIDLVTLFKALKNGVYVKFKDSIWYVPAEYVSINKGMLFCDYNIPTYAFLKHYGETWALSKEVLL